LEEEHEGCTALHIAFDFKPSTEVIMKLLELGGQELVMKKNKFGYTALHYACMNEDSAELGIMKMIELGGRELVMIKNQFGSTSLHCACNCKAPTNNVIMKMIELGGKNLVMEKNQFGSTALHYACKCKAPTKAIMKMIELGGQQLVMEKDLSVRTALHIACINESSIESIMKLVDTGGHQTVIGKDKYGKTALHYACWKKASIKVIIILVLVGGRQLIIEKTKYGNTALNYAVSQSHPSKNKVKMMLEKISSTNSDEEIKERVKAAVEAMTIAEQYSFILTAAKCGLKWNITKELVASSNVDEAVNGHDRLTGLYLFMISAMMRNDGCSHDLSSIYGFMRMIPSVEV
jgi:ankyrin repeat protein